MRYDRAKELRAKLGADIAQLTTQAEAAKDHAPQAFTQELARCEALKAKFDAALRADGGRSTRRGRGRSPKPPDDAPLPERQSNLTDPDSALMRRSDAHEHRQAYNARAVVCADGTQLISVANLVATSADAPSFAPTILGMHATIGAPERVLADTG